jgi:hypothetical protein
VKAKLTKKEQRIADEKDMLRDRLFDMLAGAANGLALNDDGEDDYLVTASVGMEELSGWMRAAKNYLAFERTSDWPQSWTDAELKERAFHIDNLRHFETLKDAADHLYSYGFRA